MKVDEQRERFLAAHRALEDVQTEWRWAITESVEMVGKADFIRGTLRMFLNSSDEDGVIGDLTTKQIEKCAYYSKCWDEWVSGRSNELPSEDGAL